MAIIPYDDFQGRLAREASNGDVIPYELGPDGVYRPNPAPLNPRRVGRPVPTRNPGLGAVAAAIDAVCLARAIAPNNFIRNVVSSSPFDIIPGVRNARERAFNRLCNETPNSQVPVGIPFLGGQCDGARYDVQAFIELRGSPPGCNISNQITGIARVWGPVASVQLGPFPGTPGQFCVVRCRGPANLPIQPPGALVSLGSYPNTPGCPPAKITGFTLTPAPGSPNNCGNPVLQPLPDEENPVSNPRLEIPQQGTNPVEVDIDVSFNPQVGIEINAGDINITFDGDNISIEEPTDPGADDTIPPLVPPGPGGSTRPSPDDTATDPDEPPPDPPSFPPYEEPEEEPDQVIRAVLVTVTADTGDRTIIVGSSTMPDNYFPDMGTVRFRCRARDGDSGFTPPIRVQGLREFIPCPWDGGAFEVVGQPRGGVTWILTPVYDQPNVPI